MSPCGAAEVELHFYFLLIEQKRGPNREVQYDVHKPVLMLSASAINSKQAS